MSIPDFQSVMLPLLQILGDCQDHVMRDVQNAVADKFKLTEEERPWRFCMTMPLAFCLTPLITAISRPFLAFKSQGRLCVFSQECNAKWTAPR